MQLTTSITGVDRLDQTFRNMPVATQNKAMRGALREGAKVIKGAAAANVRAITSDEATGLLARSLSVYSAKKYRGMLRFVVMVKKGTVTSKGVRVGKYAGVLEYGKENQPPRSWIRKALRENITKAFQAVAEAATVRIAAAVEDAKR